MPDDDLIPPGRSIAPAAPAAAGLDGILSTATTRRRRRAALVAGATSAVGLVAAVTVFGGGSGTQSLRQLPADQPGATTSASTTASPRLNLGLPSLLPHPYVTTVPSDSPSPGETASPQPTDEPTASPFATSSAAPPGTEVGPPHEVTTYDATRQCSGDGPTVAQGWCSYYDGATSGAAGHRVELAASICRMTGQGSGSLQAASGQQAEFALYDGASATELWTWSRGHAFRAQGSTLTVAAGTCLRWHVSWDVVDDDGHALAPGTYDLTARPYVAVSGAYITSNANPLTFTVT